MFKPKKRKTSFLSQIVLASVICGSALGFSGRAFAKSEQPSPNWFNSLYFNGAANVTNDVYAAGNPWQLYGIGAYSETANTTVTMDGGAISLTTSSTWGGDNYVVYAKGYHKDAVGGETPAAAIDVSPTVNLGGTDTKFVALTGKIGIVAEGAGSAAKATVTTAGKYLGIYTTSCGVGAGAYGDITLGSGSIVIKSTNAGFQANDHGNITVDGNLYVDAVYAIVALDGGEVNINLDTPAEGEKPAVENKNTTVLKGNLLADHGSSSIYAILSGKDSSWTGNVKKNDQSTIEIKLVEGATWNVTTLANPAPVTTLTMTDGFMEMRDNQGGGKAAVAKVTTLEGTTGTVHMDNDDTLDVTTIKNTNLSVYGGNLRADDVLSVATVTLNDVKVDNGLNVYGTLNGNNVVFADDTTLAVKHETDAAKSGKAVFSGNITRVYDVTVEGGIYNNGQDDMKVTGMAIFNAKQTYAHSLTANSIGSILVKGALTTKRNITANGGAIRLEGVTKVGGYDGIAAGSSDLVAKNGGTINVTGDLTADDIKVTGGSSSITINADGKKTVKLGGANRTNPEEIASGDIEMNGGTVNINFSNADSYWYGNKVGSNGTVNITLANRAKWDVTTNGNASAVTSLTMNRGVISMKNQTEEAATDAQEAAIAKVGTLTGTEGTVNMDSNDTFEVTTIGETGETLNLNVNGGILKAETVQGTVYADFFGTNITGITENAGLTVAGTLNANNAYVTAITLDVKGGTLNANNSVVTTTVNVGDGTVAGTATFGGFMSNVKNLTAKGKDATVAGKSTVKFNATQNIVSTMIADANSTITANGNLMAQHVVATNGGTVALNGGFTSIYDATGAEVGLYAYGTTTGGTITVDSNLFVNAANALSAKDKGHIEINWDADDAPTPTPTTNKNITVLNGNIVATQSEETIQAQLTGAASSWTGNVTENKDSTIEIRLYDGAKWNVTGQAGENDRVNTLTMKDGVIDMTKAHGAVACVGNLVGTKGTVDMGSSKSDMLDVENIGNALGEGETVPKAFALDVTGGRLNADKILAGAVVKLDETKVVGANELTVNGKLIGTNITAGTGIIADNGLVVLKGDAEKSIADVKSLTAKGTADNEGKIIIAAADIDATALTAKTNGTIIVKGGASDNANANITGAVTADGGKITLDSAATTVGSLVTTTKGSTIDVTSDATIGGINATNGTIKVNYDGKHKTTLNGNISGNNAGNAIINFKGAETAADASSWTGNNTGSAFITMGENVKWNVTTVADASNVNALTVNGGTIDMTAAEAATAKASIFCGTKATVNMDKNDIFFVGVNSNKNLTINGGSLDSNAAGITNNGVINLNGGTVSKQIAKGYVNVVGTGTTYANASVASKINVANGATLNINASQIGNNIVNNGTVATTGTLTKKIIGGDVNITTVTSDASNFVDNTLTVSDSKLTLTGKYTKNDKTGLFDSGVKGNGQIKIGTESDTVDTGNTISMRTSKLDNFTGEISVNPNNTLILSGDVDGLDKVLNGQTGTLKIRGDVSNVGTFVNGGTLTVAGNVGSSVINNATATATVYGDVTGGTLANYGTAEVYGDVSGQINNGSNSVSGATATIYGDVSNTISNYGEATVNGDVSGKIENSKKLIVFGDLLSGGTISSTGSDNTVTLVGDMNGTFTNDSNTSDKQDTIIYGNISGTLTNKGKLKVDGNIESGSSVNNMSGGTLVVSGDVNNAITNVGTLQLVGGDLNGNINGNGTTLLDASKKVDVANNVTIEGTLNGNNKTIDMAGGSINKLTVGTLNGTTNLKIDMADADCDFVEITTSSDNSGTINLTSVNVTESCATKDNIQIFSHKDGSGNVDLKVLGSDGGTTTTYASDGSEYTFTDSGDKINRNRNTGSHTVADGLAAAAEGFSLVVDKDSEVKNVSVDKASVDIGVSTKTATRDIYLNGYTLSSSTGNTTLKITVTENTVNRTVNISNGILDSSINLAVTDTAKTGEGTEYYAKLNLDEVTLNGGLTNTGGMVVIDKGSIGSTSKVNNNSGSMYFEYNDDINGTITNTGHMFFNGDTVVKAGATVINNDGQMFFGVVRGSSADSDIRGTVTNNKGSVLFYGKNAVSGAVTNKDAMVFLGDSDVSGAVTNNGGTMSFMGNNNVSNNLANKNSGKISFNGENVVSGGTITNNGGTIAFEGQNDVSGVIDNKDTMTFKGTNDLTNDVGNSGTMTFTGANHFGGNLEYKIENQGTMTFNESTVVDSYLHNNGDGKMTFNGTTVVNKDITNNNMMIFNGTTNIYDEIKNTDNIIFNGSAQLDDTVTNNGTINVYGNLVTSNTADITGTNGTLVIDGRFEANSTVQQKSIQLENNSTLIISADDLESNVKNSDTSWVVLTEGELNEDSVIKNGTIVLKGDVTANADSLASKTLLLDTNTLTLNGGVLDGYNNDSTIAISGNVGAKIVIAGEVKAKANVLTIDTEVNSGSELTLKGGSLADGVLISGEGSVVISKDLEARIQDLQVEGGIDNGAELTLTGEGKLQSNISNDDGDLIITGKVDAGKKKIKQDHIKVQGGELTIDVSNWTVDNQSQIIVNNVGNGKGKLYLTGDDNFDLMKYINGNGTTHIGNGTDAAKMQLHKGYEINTALVIERNATFNLNAEYENETAIVNAGTLNVDVANLGADVTNSKMYAVEHDRDVKVDGTVNLAGDGTLTNKVAGGTLNVNGNVSADADFVAADDTYVANNQTLTLTDGTLVGNLKVYDYAEEPAKVTGYSVGNKVVIDGAVVAEGDIELATTVNAGKSLTIDADNIKADVTLNNAKEGDEHGRLLLGEGTLEHNVTGGRIRLEGDVSTDAGNLVENKLVRLNSNVLTITGGDLSVIIGSKAYNGGTLKFTGTTASTKDIFTNIEVANSGNLTVNVANIKQTDKQTKNTIENNGALTLKGGTAEKAAALSREITGTGYTNIDGILETQNAISQGFVNIGSDDSLTMKGADLTATYGVANAGTLTVDAANLDAVVANAGTLNLGAGTIDKMITGAWVENAVVLGTTYITGDVTSNAAIYQDKVHIDKGNSLTVAGENSYLVAAVKMGNNTTLTIDANNLKGDVISVMDDPLDDDLESLNGTIKLGKGVLTQNLKVNTVELTADVLTTSDKINNSTNIYLEGKSLVIDDTNGTLNVAIGAETHDNGTLVIVGETDAKKAIYTNLVNAGTLTVDAANIKQVAEEVVTKKTVVNDGTLNLLGSKDEKAVAMSREITGAGTLNVSRLLTDANAITQGTVNIAEEAELTMTAALTANVVDNQGTLTMTDADLTANDYVYNRTGATLTVDAANLKGHVANLGTMNLGDGEFATGIIGVDPTDEDNDAPTAAGTLNVQGSVISNTHIAQNIVNIETGKSLTMADEAVLHVEDKITVAENAVLTVAADDLYGNVELAKAAEPAEGETAKENGKIQLGKGTLNKTITGGDVVLTGKVVTVSGNLKNGTDNNMSVNLDGNTLIINDAAPAEGAATTKLNVAIGDINNTTGNLVFTGTTELGAEVWTTVVVNETGTLTTDAGKLKGGEKVVNANELILTGGSFARKIEGTGTTTINGAVTANDYIWQKNVVVANDAELTMNGALRANVYIAAATDTEAAGILTIDAGNLYSAVNNDGILNLTGNTTTSLFTGVDESYTGFVATIKGAGTTNITEGTVYTKQDIIQKNINVEDGATFEVFEGTTVATFGEGSKTQVEGTMNVRAQDIKGNVDVVKDGTLNFVVDNKDRIGRLNLMYGFNDPVLTNSGTVNFGNANTDNQEFSIWSKIDNSGTINIYTIDTEKTGKESRIHRDMVNTGTINTYGDIIVHSNVSIDGDDSLVGVVEGAEEIHGKLVVNSGKLTFKNTDAGSLNTNVEIKYDATLDPLARVFAEDITVDNYGKLIIEKGTSEKVDPKEYAAEILNKDTFVATLNMKDAGETTLNAGYVNLTGEDKEGNPVYGKINQEAGTTLVAEGNAADKAVIQGVNKADQLNVGGSRLKLNEAIGGTLAKEQQYDLVTGDAVAEVVGQDLLTDKKLWKTVEMKDAAGNTVSNTDFDANFVTDYFLKDGDPKTIVAEVRTIKSIDEINTNGLAGVQQGALAMTAEMNDKVAEQLSLTTRPAVEKGKKYDKQIWASYIHSKEDIDDRELWNLDADNSAKYNGAIVGVDFYSSKKAIAGIAFSYATGDITANTANGTRVKNDSKYYGVSLYDRVTNGNVALTYDLGFQSGKNDIDMNAREKITSDVDTKAFTAGIRVERAYASGKNGTFAPFASVRYVRLSTDDYSNSNGSKFDNDSQNLFLPKVGLAWKGEYGDAQKGWAFKPVVEVGYAFNLGDREAETDYRSSTLHRFTAEYDVVDSGNFYGKVGMDFMNRKFTFGVDYTYLKGSTTKNNKWNVTLGWMF